MQSYSLQHWTLLSPADTSTTEHHFSFGPTTSFFLELFLSSSQEHIGHLLTWGAHLLVSYIFGFSYCSWGSWGKNTGVACHSFLHWNTFCQHSLLWPINLGWLCMAWLIASLNYASLFTTTGLWIMTEIHTHTHTHTATRGRICLQCRRPWFNYWAVKIPWRRDMLPTPLLMGFLGGSDGKESTCNAGDLGSIPGLGRSPGEALQSSPVFLPRES